MFIVQVRLSDVIARETRGTSCNSQKYSVAAPEPPLESDTESLRVWAHSAESSPRSKYIDLTAIAINDEPLLTCFLDGTRRIFKVDEIAYPLSGGRRAFYPVTAGQIITGCCTRRNKKLFPEKYSHEIVISLPEIADYDNNAKRGFWQGLARKFSEVLSHYGLEVSAVLSYKTAKDSRNTSLEDRAIAAIQTRMLQKERELTESLTHKKLLSSTSYLVKDGSIEYRKPSESTSQNYRWVIGLSKSFNPEACAVITNKPDPGYIAALPVGHRTQAACFTNSMLGDAKFAVWYIRLHDRSRTRSAFDGIVKAEKMLVTEPERNSGHINSEEIDTLSAYILNERYPVCRDSDARWANHIYPVYLTEAFIKAKFISTSTFLQLF